MRFKIGDSASMTRCFGDEEVRQFSRISGDSNPIHLDDQAASRSIFGRRVVHGALTSSLISAVLGTQLPGEGAIYLSQTLDFKAPVFIGDEITAHVEVKEIRPDKKIYTLETNCYNQEKKLVITGSARVKET